GHDVGQQQRVEQAVALGQVALKADAPGLLTPHDDFALEHVVANKFEADAVLDELTAVPGGDAVKHFCGVEGAGDSTRPALAAQNPTEQNGVDFVRVDEVAELVSSADAVGVSIGAEAGVALVGDDSIAQGANVRLDRLGIDAGKERVRVGADGDVGDTMRRKNFGENGAAGAIHGVDAELHAGAADECEIGEALDGFEIGGQEIDFGNWRGLRRSWDWLAEVGFNFRHDGWEARAAVPGFVLDAVPLG